MSKLQFSKTISFDVIKQGRFPDTACISGLNKQAMRCEAVAAEPAAKTMV
jgi:hypothetical protein